MEIETEVLQAPESSVIVAVKTDFLDASNSKDFLSTMKPILDGHAKVLLDLEAINFIVSSGLGTLLACLRTMNGKEGELRLFGMNKTVQALFELVRMHRLFPIYTTRDEALATL